MILVLRLGHRIPRDERITTHVGLVARAFGAEKIIYSGQKDGGMEESIGKIVEQWGGEFSVEYIKNGLKKVKEFKKQNYIIVHLTMYGIGVEEKIKEIKKKNNRKNLVVIVGGAQVPPEFYQIADYNLSISNQPHSEVAALSVFLHELFEGKELDKKFKGKKTILPSEKEKKIRFE